MKREISTEFLMPLMAELLEHSTIKFTNKGDSMRPFIRDGIDQVEVMKKSYDSIHVRDIVLCERYPGNYAMHRIYKKDDKAFYIVGDAQYTVEGPIEPEKILAVVIAIYRNNKRVSCDQLTYKCLVLVWMKLRRIRVRLIKLMYRESSKR